MHGCITVYHQTPAWTTDDQGNVCQEAFPVVPVGLAHRHS